MDNTLFFDKLQDRFTVSLFSVEYYAKMMSENLTELEQMEVMEDVLRKTCGIVQPVQEDFIFLIEKLTILKQEVEKITLEPGSYRQTFGSSFNKYLNSTDITCLLGKMTNYSLPAMEELYCRADFQHVQEMIRNYTQGLVEQNVVAMEAALYGSGNSYKDDTGSSAQAIDVDSKEGKAMLRQFGIGDVTTEMIENFGIVLE
jgi:hypothetical protein